MENQTDKNADQTESQSADRRDKAKAQTKFGDGEDDKQAVKETVKIWRDGSGSAVDKL